MFSGNKIMHRRIKNFTQQQDSVVRKPAMSALNHPHKSRCYVHLLRKFFDCHVLAFTQSPYARPYFAAKLCAFFLSHLSADCRCLLQIATPPKKRNRSKKYAKAGITRPASHGNKKARRDGKKSAITRELDMYMNIYKLRHASKKDRKQSNTKRENSAQKPQRNPQARTKPYHERT